MVAFNTPYIHIRQVAEWFGKSERTAIRWTQRKINPLFAKRVGKSLYTTPAAVEQFFYGSTPAPANGFSSPHHDQSLQLLREHGINI